MDALLGSSSHLARGPPASHPCSLRATGHESSSGRQCPACPQPQASARRGSAACSRAAPLRAMSSDETEGAEKLSGLHETAAIDQLIDALAASKSPQELADTVGQNLLALDQKFWIRLATRADIAQRRTEKEKYKALADTVMHLVDSMVKRTNQQLTASSDVLQKILTAAADERGEWELCVETLEPLNQMLTRQVPLPPERLEAMRAELLRHKDELDEALLSNAFAWARKCKEEGQDGMVALLQKVLQLYAAHALRTAFAPPEGSPDDVIDEVIAADEERWDATLRAAAERGVSEASLLQALQKKVEGVVLALPSGSYAQRVQAEFLKELEARTKAAYQGAQSRQAL